jgi:peptidoglycan-associated lipoprotein
MRVPSRSIATYTAAFFILGGCATTGALRKATAAQESALAQQQSALAAERAERAASDSALRQDLGMVRGDVQALKSELETMRTDFGAKITAMQDGLQFAMPVTFGFNDANVMDQDHATLDRFAKVVQRYYPGTKVTVEGFADPKGSASYNVALSKRRADAVRRYLVTQGMPTEQVATIGYGKTRLVVPDAWGDKPGADQNRRVVFVIETKPQGVVSTN